MKAVEVGLPDLHPFGPQDREGSGQMKPLVRNGELYQVIVCRLPDQRITRTVLNVARCSTCKVIHGNGCDVARSLFHLRLQVFHSAAFIRQGPWTQQNRHHAAQGEAIGRSQLVRAAKLICSQSRIKQRRAVGSGRDHIDKMPDPRQTTHRSLRG